MRNLLFSWCLLCMCGISVAHANLTHTADVDLSETQAVALFYQRNLDLIAAHFQIAQSKAQEIIAAAIPNPVLSLNLLEIDGSGRLGNDGAGPGIAIGVTQLLETAGKRRLREESSALGTASAEEDLKDAIRTLTAAVKRAYYGLVLAQNDAAVAQETVDQYDHIVHANEVRLAHGDVAESDLWRVKVEAFKSHAELITANVARDKARTELAALLRWPDDAMRFTAQNTWPANHGPIEGDLDAEIARTLRERPDLLAARHKAAQAKAEYRLAKRIATPDVTIGAGFTHDVNNLNDNTVNLSLSVPLPVFYRNQGEITKSAVIVSQSELQVEQLEQTARKEITAASANWRGADAIARGFESDVIKQARQIRNGAEQAYLKGASSVLDLLDAQRNYREVMHDYQTTLYNRTIASIDLQTALSVKEEQ